MLKSVERHAEIARQEWFSNFDVVLEATFRALPAGFDDDDAKVLARAIKRLNRHPIAPPSWSEIPEDERAHWRRVIHKTFETPGLHA